MRKLCKYGESPMRLALWVLGVVIVFALAYYPSPLGFIKLDGVVWNDGLFSLHNAMAALHFSLITFATLGYGDIYPGDAWAQVYTCVEVMAGYALLGVFVALVARKLAYN